MRFRTKIFFSVLAPAGLLVSAAAAAALAALARSSEEAAGRALRRTRNAFEGVLREQLDQLKRLSAPFSGARFDAALSEAVLSGDLDIVRQLVEDDLALLQSSAAVDFLELRSRKGDLLLRRSLLPGAGEVGELPFQAWIARREEALTEFQGEPFLAVRIEHERGYFVFGRHFRPALDRLVADFGVQVVLFREGRAVYASLAGAVSPEVAEGSLWVGGRRYLASAGRPPSSELEPMVLLYSMEGVDREKRAVIRAGAAGLAAALALAAMIAARLSRRVSGPVETLVEAARRVGAGDYEVRVDIRGRDEMSRLGGAFNEMTEGLRKRREIMDKTLSPDVAEELMRDLSPGGERREATVLFLDVRGFTSATEGVDPARVVAVLNDMMDFLAEAVARHGGNVNKFLGDGLMAMFGAPRDLPDHPRRAVEAAREMMRGMRAWNARRAESGGAPFQIGIGINTGVVLGGRVGSRRRLEYTLIGEEVNLASRVCAKASPGQILVTRATFERLGGGVPARPLEPLVVKGLSYPVPVYEVDA